MPKIPTYILTRNLPTKPNSLTFPIRPTLYNTTQHRVSPSPQIPALKMHSMLDNDWDLTDITTPHFRKVGFAEDGPQLTVTTGLRHAWTHIPPSDTDTNIQKFMQEDNARTDEERALISLNPDTATLHTPWRDQVYYMFNHLFYDVANFMSRMYGVGHLHPPNEGVVGLRFPGEGGEGQEVVLREVWETEVLVIPAYLAPGVTVRMETVGGGEAGAEGVIKMRGRFSEANLAEIWYIGEGVESRFYIEREGGGESGRSNGLAAVLAYGKLDNQCHPRNDGENEG